MLFRAQSGGSRRRGDFNNLRLASSWENSGRLAAQPKLNQWVAWEREDLGSCIQSPMGLWLPSSGRLVSGADSHFDECQIESPARRANRRQQIY